MRSGAVLVAPLAGTFDKNIAHDLILNMLMVDKLTIDSTRHFTSQHHLNHSVLAHPLRRILKISMC